MNHIDPATPDLTKPLVVYSYNGTRVGTGKVLTTDFRGFWNRPDETVLVLVTDADGMQFVTSFNPAGRNLSGGYTLRNDKKQCVGWINIYKTAWNGYVPSFNFYPSEKAALDQRSSDCLATVSVSWEE